MNEIQTLLQRRAEGTLTAEELDRLNQLTHRDDVVSAAAHRASVLRKHQMQRLSALGSVLLVAAVGSFLWFSPSHEQEPLMAQSNAVKESPIDRVEVPQIDEQENVEQYAKAEVPSASHSAAVHETPTRCDTADQVVESAPLSVPLDQLVIETPANSNSVACNTQCAPDSVINDIWLFLKA